MVADLNKVSRCSTPVLYYDTTYCLGDFYVSALLYCNDTFEGAQSCRCYDRQPRAAAAEVASQAQRLVNRHSGCSEQGRLLLIK